ncbi:ankyrin-3 [Trichoderma arundinaceum]|uniref:Ankyrin-3 n=1 Tax=Trichoderma arundinaceum TaxID=490622 RepID=A0A395NUF4_TRIAR|nr:ankyrin-3 [Trichoderma arundinaceum]
MDPIDIMLFEGGERDSGFRTKNAPGDTARRVLIDRGEALIIRASLVSVTHGDFTPDLDSDAASLLIFEFSFITTNHSRRFTSAQIKLIFHDESGNIQNRPHVWAIAPQGKLSINKTASAKDIRRNLDFSLNGEILGVGARLGYVWETTQVQNIEHATVLTGSKRLLETAWGKDNAVIWSLQEDHKRKQGIPSFLRAAVLLRRKNNVPFSFSISVDSGVDFSGLVRRMMGREKIDQIDPVKLDDDTDLDDLGIESLDLTATGVDNMKELNIEKYADIMIATLLNIAA